MFLGSLTSFAHAEQASDRFEALLKGLGVTLTIGGELERLHLVLKELADWHSGAAPAPSGVDLRKRFRELVGTSHIVDLALSIASNQLGPFKNHFELLNVGTPLQNIAAPRNDPSADKVFELLVGLAAVRMGAAVTVDDPNVSKGDNPDVLADYAGTAWGFACKVISGDAPATLFERIEDGIDQIERSRATRGFVVISFKNRFDHEIGMPSMGVGDDGEPLLGTHRDHASVVAALRRFAEERLAAMAMHATEPEVAKLFQGKKALPGVLVVSQTTAGVRLPAGVAPPGLNGAPVVARVGFLHLISLESTPLVGPSRFDAGTAQMLHALNQALHV